MARNPEWIQRERLDPFDLNPLPKAIIYNASLEMIRALYHGNPNAIVSSDYLGRLPLHTSIIFKSSKDVIKFLLSAYPDACKLRENNGKLPIDLILEEDTFDDELLESFVNAYPESIGFLVDGTTVLHRITRKRSVSTSLLANMVTNYPNALRVVDDYGTLPIHNAVNNESIRSSYRTELNILSDNSNNDIILLMLQHYPEAATIRDGNDTSLLEMAVMKDYPTNVIQSILEANVNAVREKDCDNGNLILHTLFNVISTTRNSIDNAYTTTVLLITAYPESLIIQNDQYETPLHSLLSLSSPISMSFWSYAPLIINYIIDECPECLQIVDWMGLLPLHRISLLTVQDRALVNDGFLSILRAIVDNYPDGTRIADNTGHLPIRIIVLLNLNPSVLGISCPPILRSVLDTLLRTYPESIVEVIDVMMNHNLFSKEEFYRNVLQDYIAEYTDKFLNQPIVYYNRNKGEMVRTNDVLLLHMVCCNKNCTIELIQFLLKHNPQALVQYSYDVTRTDIFTMPSNDNTHRDIVRVDDDDSYHRMPLAALTPFHVLCRNTRLLSTMKYSDIDTILKLCPEAATTKTIHWVTGPHSENLTTTTTTTNGFLPIFVACQYDAPLDVIRCLLEYSWNQLFI